jgi:hypothetical protein
MSISQVGSLIFVAAALALWFYLRRQPTNARSARPAAV